MAEFPENELNENKPVLWGTNLQGISDVKELQNAVAEHKNQRNQVFRAARNAYNAKKQELDTCNTEKQNIQQQQSQSEQERTRKVQEAQKQAEQAQAQTAIEKKRADDADQKYNDTFRTISASLFQGGASHDTWQTAWMTRARKLGGHGGKGGVYRVPLHR